MYAGPATPRKGRSAEKRARCGRNRHRRDTLLRMPALDGISVVDFSRVLAGPLVAMTLGRPRRGRRQGRVAGRRRHPALASARRRAGTRGLPPRRQPQQALGRARPEGRHRPGARPAPVRARGRGRLELQAGDARAVRPRLRRRGRCQPRCRLLRDQRLRRPRREGDAGLRPARAGGGRADEHLGPARHAVEDRRRGRRRGHRALCDGRRASPRCTSASAPASASASRSTCCTRTWRCSRTSRPAGSRAGRCRRARQRAPEHRAVRDL